MILQYVGEIQRGRGTGRERQPEVLEILFVVRLLREIPKGRRTGREWQPDVIEIMLFLFLGLLRKTNKHTNNVEYFRHPHPPNHPYSAGSPQHLVVVCLLLFCQRCLLIRPWVCWRPCAVSSEARRTLAPGLWPGHTTKQNNKNQQYVGSIQNIVALSFRLFHKLLLSRP